MRADARDTDQDRHLGGLPAHPGLVPAAGRLDHLAVLQGADRDGRGQPAVPAQGADPRELQRHPQQLRLPGLADQLVRHRGDLDVPVGDPGDARGVRDRPPGVQGQAAGAVDRAGDRDVPGGRAGRAAVRPVADARPVQHLAGPDHPVHVVHAAAGDLDAVGVLPRDPVGDGAGGPGRRRDLVAGVPQGDRAAGGTGRLHRGDPDVLLRLERVRARALADVDDPVPHGPGAAVLLRRARPVQPAVRTAGHRLRGGHRPDHHHRPVVPAKDRRRAHVRRGEGVTRWLAIEMKNIVKKYGDGFPAVNDVSIDVQDGEFMILVGPSGCGKSTLLRMIVGLEDITSGDMMIGDKLVNDLAPRDRNLAMVFQNYALYPHLTVYENIAFPLRLAKASDDRDRQEGPRGGQDPRARRAPRAQAGQPLRRPAAARRDGPRDRARGRRVPLRRAAVEPRRQAARPDAHRDLPAAEAARHHHGLRHPRPDRGDDARRPGRGAQAGPAAAARDAARALREPRQPLRRRLHRLAADELPARHGRGHLGEAAVRHGRAAARAGGEGRRARGC